MEDSSRNLGPEGPRGNRKSAVINHLLPVFGAILKASGLHFLGMRNALDIGVRRLEMRFPNLPEAFDGYTILHMSDLHIDKVPGLPESLGDVVRPLRPDLCVLTGDYRAANNGPFEHVVPMLRQVVDEVTVRDGILATLGNHDCLGIGDALEEMGVRLLANEKVSIRRGGAQVTLTGIDDVNRFYTRQADFTLSKGPDGFGIALVHSPEMAAVAARAGFALYLCGHTHGGQICLPGGAPILTQMTEDRVFAKGLWQCGRMIGFTTNGAGCSGLPVRFFCPPEVALITLRTGAKGSKPEVFMHSDVASINTMGGVGRGLHPGPQNAPITRLPGSSRRDVEGAHGKI